MARTGLGCGVGESAGCHGAVAGMVVGGVEVAAHDRGAVGARPAQDVVEAGELVGPDTGVVDRGTGWKA